MSILTMNQSVFGSSFETTRRSNFTEQAINSDLIIPDSAVELSYEEMEYIDGGMSVWTKVGIIAAAVGVSVVIGAAIATGTIAAVAAVLKMTFAQYVAKVGAAAVTKIILGVLGGSAAAGITIAGILIG